MIRRVSFTVSKLVDIEAFTAKLCVELLADGYDIRDLIALSIDDRFRSIVALMGLNGLTTTENRSFITMNQTEHLTNNIKLWVMPNTTFSGVLSKSVT